MIEWFLPIEESFVSFWALEDLYDKLIGLAFCFVLSKNEQEERLIYHIESKVNGQRQSNKIWGSDLLDLDHIWL